MSAFRAVMDEFEVALKSGMPGKRTEVLRKLTALFSDGAEISEEQIALFDDVMSHLVSHIEREAVAELSGRLASVANIPRGIVRRLATDDAIEIAGPVLEKSDALTDDDLVGIAQTKGRAHQLKIAGRSQLNEAVTEILIDGCDPEILDKVAANKGARFSSTGFSKLGMLADGDDHLTAIVAQRTDLPPYLFNELLARATDKVRQMLLTSAPPEVRGRVKEVLNDIAGQIGAKVTTNRYAAAQRLVRVFSQDTHLTKRKLLEFVKDQKIEETVATLAALSAVPIELVDRLMYNASPYGIMVLCKVTALYWNAAREVVRVRPRKIGDASVDWDEFYDDYENISASSAQRLLRFWQSRQTGLLAGAVAGAPPADLERVHLNA